MGDAIQWTPASGPIDDTPGYNDLLCVKENRQVGTQVVTVVQYEDRFDAQHVDQYTLASSEEVNKSGLYRPENGDQLLQVGKAFVIRKPIYTDRCLDLKEDGDAPKMYTFSSEEMVKALAFFSASTSGGTFWCKAETPGRGSALDIKTPWNLETSDGVAKMRKAVEAVEAARTDTAKDVQGLAAAVTSAELTSIKTDLEARFKTLKTKEESWTNRPMIENIRDLALAGLLFAVGSWAIDCVRHGQCRPRWPKNDKEKGPKVEPKDGPVAFEIVKEPLAKRIHVSDHRPAGPRQLPIEKIFPQVRPFEIPHPIYTSWDEVPNTPNPHSVFEVVGLGIAAAAASTAAVLSVLDNAVGVVGDEAVAVPSASAAWVSFLGAVGL